MRRYLKAIWHGEMINRNFWLLVAQIVLGFTFVFAGWTWWKFTIPSAIVYAYLVTATAVSMWTFMTDDLFGRMFYTPFSITVDTLWRMFTGKDDFKKLDNVLQILEDYEIKPRGIAYMPNGYITVVWMDKKCYDPDYPLAATFKEDGVTPADVSFPDIVIPDIEDKDLVSLIEFSRSDMVMKPNPSKVISHIIKRISEDE